MNFPELQQFIIFQTGGPHSYRTIYMDGRAVIQRIWRPAITATASATSKAIRWSWTRSDTTKECGSPISKGCRIPDRLHTIERFTRTDFNTMRYELTIDDPGAYTATWKTGWWVRFTPEPRALNSSARTIIKPVK